MFTMWVTILQTSFLNMLLVLHEWLLLRILTSCFFRNLFTLLSLFDSSSGANENFIENKALLDYSKLSEGAEVVKPSSMALSEFHFLLLLGNKVKVCMHFCIIVLFSPIRHNPNLKSFIHACWIFWTFVGCKQN